jgi:CDP-6-deoxy-D-xylo-4-hexulose-3-dehydrase
LLPRGEFKKYPQVEHVHFFGFYIGNYPHLSRKKILRLCALLNRQPARHD